MNETSFDVGVPDILEQVSDVRWFINYNEEKDEFYLKTREESTWVYDDVFYNEEDAIDYFCTHRLDFFDIHEDIKDVGRGVDLILEFSFNRYVIIKYSTRDFNDDKAYK